ncbi:bifunctional folylpolyglutamate synthase/dihydrofolate synthase [Sporolactobacillus terrae]|uniref:Dihydrofolate synthase/folylpolyglutamate synthase n=1 Tax=Sporolactobacillus terrae TaxID=269673 RepID=A0A410D9Y0_9BACL|nr:folylpolyglutamate synthase/dihydrofolate synthase family protein [Sporolactobacillus terrae]QAA22932.1 bifunctional folylpolyglutamate synthase/dihydrofolate synthase [Sporolactobacillus terrae]QAA25905.1 bifunctional folylpolyglutamate synthase/dihydrofolate synthase [Sporolactobacillus terrae]UAK17779.1 bifunctional folylpolyglutamate synthase/dihydrofolate synthase [Sporolactobacillus terrae]BBN99329.1 bifunctional folylpolyglutamate synthase/dihydrofolate synthase [Sporolactobacillus te
MFETIDETLNWIHGLIPHGIKPGTKRMEWMLAELGNPQQKIRAVHVGGTNGKGSTVCYLWHIYQASGMTVGTFISPYITSFNERIMVNGKPIRDQDLIKAANLVYPLTLAVDRETDLGLPTEFEVVTMLSFVYFAMIHPCDLVIYEVGLGGRLDSTNVIHPLVSVITNVAMDHMKQLGNTIKQIAFEKAGIIKEATAIVTTAEHPDAQAVIRDKAREKNAELYLLNTAFSYDSLGHDEDGEHFNFTADKLHLNDLVLHMRGEHQLKNASAALMAVQHLAECCGLPITEAAIREGLLKAAWPGRFERMKHDPLVIIDGAHNVQGTEALVRTLTRYYEGRTIHLLYAALKDKQYEQMIHLIESAVHDVTFTSFDYPRAASSDLLYAAGHHRIKKKDPDWMHALNDMIAKTKAGEMVLVCGSLYFISAVRHALRDGKSNEMRP